MHQIQLTIKALSPLAIGRQKPGGSVSEAQTYIPGSVIRGAIAHTMIQQLGQPEAGDDFHQLFLDENPAIFQNAYPAIAKVRNQDRVLPGEVRVIPATAVSSKTQPGFKSNSNNHGVFDTLIDYFCAEGYNHGYDPNHPVDGGRIEPHSGFYSCIDTQYYQPSITTRLLTRVGINRRRATSEEQVLYSIQVLNEVEGKTQQPATYKGAILLENETLAKELLNFINTYPIRLGGSASRGLGKVKITPKLSPITTNIDSRITQFNEKLAERWQMWTIFGESSQDLLNGRTYFTLDLQSDAILTENWQRTTVISPAMLRQFTGVEDSSLERHVAYSSYDYRSGWNSAWGLMKDVELVTNKGAVYLFSTTQLDKWLGALANLENRGVGERTAEGFGQVQICNEFHTVFREDAA
jgi:CRISPR-associated protein Csx10